MNGARFRRAIITVASLMSAVAVAQTPLQSTSPLGQPIPRPLPTPLPAPATVTPIVPKAVQPNERHTETPAQAVRPPSPLEGANSFTENQARERLKDGGYRDVRDLVLDKRGIWRGVAMRNGQPIPVALDYRGNIFHL